MPGDRDRIRNGLNSFALKRRDISGVQKQPQIFGFDAAVLALFADFSGQACERCESKTFTHDHRPERGQHGHHKRPQSGRCSQVRNQCREIYDQSE